MTTLPRPSRPSIAPPTGPLPSLPVAKSRASNVSPASKTPGASLLPSLATANRAVSSSALPQRPTPKSHSGSASSVPTLSADNSPAGPLPPGKSLRKTVSIGAFPQPPKHNGRNASHPPSPLSASATADSDTLDQRLSSAATLSRQGSLRRTAPRSSLGGRNLLKSPLTPPSLLNGSGDSVSVINTSHLSLPSPPQSRNSSAQGSYATSATTIEDVAEEDSRGRSDSKTTADGHSNQKDGKGNVIVSVRIRPDVGAKDSKQELEWDVNAKRSLIAYKGREGGDYYYDNVFDTQDNNRRVYDAAAKRLVRRVMEGYHGTVFAYGMTGTGKTFSMQGTATNPGVIPLAITDIFSYIRETPQREFLLRVSYLEIYNEKINDLLAGPVQTGPNGQSGPQEEIKLREDSKRGVYATPLKEEIVQSPTQLLRVIARGDNARRVAGTQFNARSSRSHAVVQIVVESRERVVPGIGSLKESKRSAIAPGGVRVSTLSLIDLAGSEKAADSKERRTEGSHINKSLLTLGTVIARLSSEKDKSGSDKDKPSKEGKHLPYRDSKLTRLLQPALSGNSLVSILCTIQIGASGSVAAATSHTGETLNTLKFAARAKNNIVSHAKKADESLGAGADVGSRALLDRYRLEIQELRKQLEEQNKAKETKGKDEEEEKEKAQAREEDKFRHEEQMLEMQLARTALKERIEHLNRLILSSKSLGVNTNRSFSAMSMQHRGSVLSNGGDYRVPISARSSASHSTLEVPGQGMMPSVAFNTLPLEGSEEDDSLGDNGDGTASQAAQIQSLQADLADKTRYIGTLEKRLLQARRSSHSRVSMSLSQKLAGTSEDGGLVATIAEKDAEISNLRAQLEDKERMIAALTSAGRKRDNAHEVGSEGSPGSRRTSHRRSEGSTGSLKVKGSPISPVGFLSNPKSETQKMADVTRMLDEMISGRVDNANGARRSSLRPVSEDR
ncbi:kinesin-domain-containing protein [Lojkania enalia]|uniref:Kinesin-like protein n=1 Tax=Lojkania enalia TaxID=147567 RepID=A0A9P4N540_9PLEO|nr:kinesin-domain-containing protein [Didymosphaeria enalia]